MNHEQSEKIKAILSSVAKANIFLPIKHIDLYTLQEDSTYKEYKKSHEKEDIFNQVFSDKSSLVEIFIFWKLIEFIPIIKNIFLNNDLKLIFGNQNNLNQPDFILNDEIFEITGFFLKVLKFKQNNIEYEKSLSTGEKRDDGKITIIFDDVISEISLDFRKTIEKKIKKSYIENNVVNLVVYHGHMTMNGNFDGSLILWDFFQKNSGFAREIFKKIKTIFFITYMQTKDMIYQIKEGGSNNIGHDNYIDYIVVIDINSIPFKWDNYDTWFRRMKIFKKSFN